MQNMQILSCAICILDRTGSTDDLVSLLPGFQAPQPSRRKQLYSILRDASAASHLSLQVLATVNYPKNMYGKRLSS